MYIRSRLTAVLNWKRLALKDNPSPHCGFDFNYVNLNFHFAYCNFYNITDIQYH